MDSEAQPTITQQPHVRIQRQSTEPPATNVVWEYTQAVVTILITCAAIYCAILGVKADVLNFAFVAVISTYYARTNHMKVRGTRKAR